MADILARQLNLDSIGNYHPGVHCPLSFLANFWTGNFWTGNFWNDMLHRRVTGEIMRNKLGMRICLNVLLARRKLPGSHNILL